MPRVVAVHCLLGLTACLSPQRPVAPSLSSIPLVCISSWLVERKLKHRSFSCHK